MCEIDRGMRQIHGHTRERERMKEQKREKKRQDGWKEGRKNSLEEDLIVFYLSEHFVTNILILIKVVTGCNSSSMSVRTCWYDHTFVMSLDEVESLVVISSFTGSCHKPN